MATKLQPVYVALEGHQFSRAIKLCLAQPPSNLMARALLAHAYAKSDQRLKALNVIQSILGSECFPELQLEIKYCVDRSQQESPSSATLPAQLPVNAAATNKKGGKKGKKKVSQPASSNQSTSQSQTSETVADDDWDLIDQLDHPPALPDDWDKLPAPDGAPTDLQLLATLSMTMLGQLRLPLTNFQMYCWAASSADTEEVLLRKAYLAGFAVLVSIQYEHLTSAMLAHMQVLALQLARIQQQQFGVAPATAWAAQTALWQLKYYQPDTAQNEDDASKNQQKLAMLPRLAESLASKCVQAPPVGEEDSLILTENFFLYMRTLDIQEKWQEKLNAVDERLAAGGELMAPPRRDLLDLKANTLLKLQRPADARVVVEELLEGQPDDWKYWRLHIDCVEGEEPNNESALSGTEDLIVKLVAQTESNGRSYPLRGPHLMRVEVAMKLAENTSSGSSNRAVTNLVHRIIEYGDLFSSRVSCAFSDILPYLEYCLECCSESDALLLLEWAQSKFVGVEAVNNTSLLGSYVFAAQTNFKVLTKFSALREHWLLDWKNLLAVWKSFRLIEETSSDTNKEMLQAAKEIRPADELILLAVQQLLEVNLQDFSFIWGAFLLELAIEYSPYNPYLKIMAILVYSNLNAVERSWQLYGDLFIKHVQHESCAHLILTMLRSNGYYRELIQVCREILRLHTAAVRDASEYSSRAMENGTLSKADEFLSFQRDKMNYSLTSLEVKGLVLDSAPMYILEEDQVSLGAMHGIVGGDEDMDRAKQMVAEAHNPSAAFSLLHMRGLQNGARYSDNRDLSILTFSTGAFPVFETQEQVLDSSLRRGRHHNLLIRAAMCVDATKGPKKGKLVKTSIELHRRCLSLQAIVCGHEIMVDREKGVDQNLSDAMHQLCKSIVLLAGGVYDDLDQGEDTLEIREQMAEIILRRAVAIMKDASDSLSLGYTPLVHFVGRLVPDFVVPLFAVFRMCAKVLDIYGWGRRKRKSKICSAAFADFSLLTYSLVDDLLSMLSSLPNSDEPADPSYPEISQLSVDEVRRYREIWVSIHQSRISVRHRIESVLQYIKSQLLLFDVDD